MVLSLSPLNISLSSLNKWQIEGICSVSNHPDIHFTKQVTLELLESHIYVYYFCSHIHGQGNPMGHTHSLPEVMTTGIIIFKRGLDRFIVDRFMEDRSICGC